jgi:hypothetical protein
MKCAVARGAKQKPSAATVDSRGRNAQVTRTKTFNARLATADLKKFAAKARRCGLSQTPLLREWIHTREVPTVADAARWEERNLGNRRLRISRG